MVYIFIEADNNKVPEYAFLEAIFGRLGIAQEMYEIISTAGYTNLLNESQPFIEKMRSNTDAGGMNLVMFDADTTKNNGGFQKRMEELLTGRDQFGLDFDLFLWPDNQGDGDVEVLMERIARHDLYPEIFDCLGKYEHCISSRKNDKGEPFYTVPNLKNKLHTYFTSLPIAKTKKDKFGHGLWRWEDENIWDLNSDALTPIKTFLSQYFPQGSNPTDLQSPNNVVKR